MLLVSDRKSVFEHNTAAEIAIIDKKFSGPDSDCDQSGKQRLLSNTTFHETPANTMHDQGMK